ncbi:site-specific integrase [Marinobacter halodurans]|uniref:Site-specific integrase n=1 Tax=Marinobacter halodurans TaxID=2528979 RepID=A0ABY1ZPA5_9GAMM|nr:site-specific integrase [Marinobacter halodurans]TBW57420.1 site-specific integrase [Marinobacter halodurans]
MNIHPLFDTPRQLLDCGLTLDNHPSLAAYINEAHSEAYEDWRVTAAFLMDYAASMGTYTRFRGEVQRFLLFLWNISKRSLRECTEDDINRYMRFLKKPPKAWVGEKPLHAFESSDGERVAIAGWRPFFATKKVIMRQTTLDAATRSLKTFFRTLVSRGYISRSPMAHARRAEQKASRESFDEEHDHDLAPRLTDEQWHYLKEGVETAADQDEKYERHLFVVITMKTLYLRVSELAPQKNELTDEIYNPTMAAFGQKIVDGKKYWHLKVFGKGSKTRYVPLPAAYLPYLKRFRRWRALPQLPERGEKSPMIPRRNGSGQVGKRTLERLVRESFLIAAERMENDGKKDAAAEMEQIANHSHYLRHTGASMDIDAGRPIRHVSEDLGHTSVAFTEAIYISASKTERYTTGLKRAI